MNEIVNDGKYRLTWEKYVNDCNKLASLIKDKSLHTLPILCISRGGLIPGAIISHLLDTTNIRVIGV